MRHPGRLESAWKAQRFAGEWNGAQVETRAIVDAADAAAKQGDWRAGFALIERVHGKPQERVEVTDPLETKDWREMTPDEIDALLAKLLDEHGEAAE